MPILAELLTQKECCELLGINTYSFSSRYSPFIYEYKSRNNICYYDKKDLINQYEENTGFNSFLFSIPEELRKIGNDITNEKYKYLDSEIYIKNINIVDIQKLSGLKVPFIYILKNERKIIYIGKSTVIKNRLIMHLKSEKVFDSIDLLLYSDFSTYNKAEELLIIKYTPEFNYSFNPNVKKVKF